MITDGTTPLGVLALLGLAGATLALGGVLAYALLRGSSTLARITAGLLLAGWCVYGAVLAALSLTSPERVLGRGAEKHICELDCHLAYSVLAVTTDRAAGRLVVSLRVRFDSATISARRGMAPLTPGPRRVAAVAADGRGFPPLPDPQAPPLTRPLVPGEAYTTTLTFALPADARAPRLLIGAAAGWPDRLLIGSENSLWHARVYFAL